MRLQISSTRGYCRFAERHAWIFIVDFAITGRIVSTNAPKQTPHQLWTDDAATTIQRSCSAFDDDGVKRLLALHPWWRSWWLPNSVRVIYNPLSSADANTITGPGPGRILRGKWVPTITGRGRWILLLNGDRINVPLLPGASEEEEKIHQQTTSPCQNGGVTGRMTCFHCAKHSTRGEKQNLPKIKIIFTRRLRTWGTMIFR